MRLKSGLFRYRRARVGLAWLLVAILVAACSTKQPEASPSPSATGTVNESLAEDWLIMAQNAAREMGKFAFELQMNQKLGEEGKEGRSDVRVDMQGRVERNPLKLDQTIRSVIDKEQSTVRSIVTPEAYYMYLPEYEEWSKLSKASAAENVATLSDFQVRPELAVQRIQQLGRSLTAESNGSLVTVRYDGNGPEASAFAAGLLRSTLGITDPEADVAERVKIGKMSVIFTMDAEKHWPLSYRIETDLKIELNKGEQTPISQTVAGTYSKPNATASIVVPKEALNAPDPDEIGQ
ncbi:DUF6612 family protein [Cohnella terricola]|uniref:LppX_LprAFG lipoprotein n=1 Tax=Cohnella terricola TaxID=1289167 RepID=A0A559JB98_9BACL|nr:DUF6612 family protein [Cohnella terricola]TVX97135.1 hypothetical protein FPZ45_19500 [Cohnella terricola]